MDYDAYRATNFVDPEPTSRFGFRSTGGVVLVVADFEAALAFYTGVLGEPAYSEGPHTRGWRIGDSWLTLLAGGDGAPSNTEIQLVMESPEEAERLQAALIAAGATGPEPSDQLMYQPVRSCPVTDPFGTEFLIYAPL